MAVLKFSRSDVEHLAEKLETLKADLSHREQVLLLAIFSAAAEQVSQVWPEDTGDTDLENLRYRLISSFLPDGFGDEFIVCPMKHTIPPPPPPSPYSR